MTDMVCRMSEPERECSPPDGLYTQGCKEPSMSEQSSSAPEYRPVVGFPVSPAAVGPEDLPLQPELILPVEDHAFANVLRWRESLDISERGFRRREDHQSNDERDCGWKAHRSPRLSRTASLRQCP